MMTDFESIWNDGFYGTMSMKVTIFASQRKHLVVEDKPIDTGAFYLKAIGLLASDILLDLNKVTAHELGTYPPCYLKENAACDSQVII